MLVKRGKGDYPRVYRPCSYNELFGQDEIKQIIISSFSDNAVSHAYLFQGPSGIGKTTCARIIGMGLLCENNPLRIPCGICQPCEYIMNGWNTDYREINSADVTQVDRMREMKNQFSSPPLFSRYKVFVFDECHRMSEASQSLLLKEVEDPSEFTYFIFCSTNPEKIIEPLRNRCMPLEFKLVEAPEIERMLVDVCDWEGLTFSNGDLMAIVQKSEGKPRNALFELQKAVAAGTIKRNGADRVFSMRYLRDGGKAMVVSLSKPFDVEAFKSSLKQGLSVIVGDFDQRELWAPNAALIRAAGDSIRINTPFKPVPANLVGLVKECKPDILRILNGNGEKPEPDPDPPEPSPPPATTPSGPTHHGKSPSKNLTLNRVQDWSSKTVNCCNGCSNACLYCYARGEAVLRFSRLTEEEWKLGAVREKDVARNYPKDNQTVMFPSTHDITWDNFEACHTVLCKLVKAGNRVLVVSKPRPELIGILLDDFEGHKDQIAFRFTIGARSDDILSFWEPGAPNFADRKEALMQARARGFRTSVSMEPMLDSDNVSDLVGELGPFVNWRIWIGTMNHAWYIKKYQDPAIDAALAKIEEGQTVERLQTIYDQYRDDPLIRFKGDFLKRLGLPLNNKSENWPEV